MLGGSKGKAPRLSGKAESGEREDRNGGGSLAVVQVRRLWPDPLGGTCEGPDFESDELLSRDERERCAGEEEGELPELCNPAGETLCRVCFRGKWRG